MPKVRPGSVEAEKDLIAPEHSRGAIAERDGHSPFPVVGIGASAGGLEATSRLLEHVSADTGMAFLVVQHLDPHHESHLAEILDRSTAMPVQEAAHGTDVLANHVYVIPPDTNLAIAQGKLLLSPRAPGVSPHLPVDYLFRSLAEEQQRRAIAVVLSGNGSDGTLGLCEIKAVGGITFAQDEGSARHGGMPHSARESGCVDFVLAPDKIAERLREIGAHPYLSNDPAAALRDAEQYGRIIRRVHAHSGVDFALYRDSTIRRRIMRRMAVHSLRSMADYVRLLESDRGETDALYHDLLINVTSFFRDPELFDFLKARIFPEIVKEKFPTAPLRVWVPGCSTGQEAYSLGIALLEFFDSAPVRPPIQIFATDLSDQKALEKARGGVYPETIEAEVSPERLHRFFQREDHVYRIDRSLRDMCVFARQNVAADPPFSHVDLISCRNVLIYLASPLQKRVLPTFHYALNVPGYLVLGSAETAGDNAELFELVDRGNRVYAKKPGSTRLPSRAMPDFMTFPSAARRRPAALLPDAGELQRDADRLLLGRYAPPGVLVDENLNVIQFRGRTSAFLEAPSGEPTTNVLKMAREGLLLELRNALAEAKKLHQPVRRTGVVVHHERRRVEIALEVLPLPQRQATPACYLVLFHEPSPAGEAGHAESAPGTNDAAHAPGESESDQLVQLRQELSATREYMQALTEQQDAANEELRSANEEILSSNEELQSTNEELETAKEELQSTNEELTTVNEQIHQRNAELTQANNDMVNLLSSTDIPVVMVGADLHVRRFTPPARKVMNLLPTDIGRPIGHLRPAIDVPDLEERIREVIGRAQWSEREVQDRDGRWHLLRIYPYRTSDQRIEDAVIVLVDIDQIKSAEESLREADRRKDEFLAVLAHELRNPIAPIRNAVEIMHLAIENPRAVSDARDVLDRQVAQLSRIVDDLIDVSRIVERKIELRPERVAVESVVQMAIETCRSLIEACHHGLVVSLPPQPLVVNADPARLSQVLVNLMNNAAKYMRPGGTIWLTAGRVPAPESAGGRGEELRISIRDAGVGIDADLLPRIFEMFAQGERVIEHSRGGLGIGLTLARSLVEMHGGRIEVKSGGTNQGSEFVVHLPLVADALPALPEPPGGGAPSPDPGGKRRILVVDDNRDQAESLAMLLELQGHEVHIAHDGQEALDLALKAKPETALIDIGLPTMSGYEVARRIREHAELRGMTLVAQTGWGQPSDRHRSEEAGFDHHIVKPIDLKRLQGILAGSARPAAPGAAE